MAETTAEAVMRAQDESNTVLPELSPEPEDQGTLDLEIEVVDDRPLEDRREDVSQVDENGETLTERAGRAQKRIDKLKWEYHEERRKAEAAGRLAEEAVEHTQRLNAENERLKKLVQSSKDAITEQASKRADGALQLAEDRFRIAHEEGDSAKIAAAQKDMTQALMAKNMAPNVANRVVQQWQAEFAGEQEKETKQEARPIEQPEPDERTKQWYADNPWFGPDKIMTSTAYGIHEKLVMEDGVSPDTEEYYEQLDTELRKIYPNHFEESPSVDVEADAPSQPRPARVDTVVAPATRNNGALPSRKIQLTATQVALARRLGLTKEQYARQLIKEQS